MVLAANEIKDALSHDTWHLHFSDIHFERKLGKGTHWSLLLSL